MPENYLCYGNNFDDLRQHIKDEGVDPVYLDKAPMSDVADTAAELVLLNPDEQPT